MGTGRFCPLLRGLSEYSVCQAVPSTLFQGLVSPSRPLCKVGLGFGPFRRQDLGPDLCDSDTSVSVTVSQSPNCANCWEPQGTWRLG